MLTKADRERDVAKAGVLVSLCDAGLDEPVKNNVADAVVCLRYWCKKHRTSWGQVMEQAEHWWRQENVKRS
jgi:hypothetical protein